MKILIVTQYFYPENFKSNDLAFELVKRGYEVDALVGIPNYPEGKIYKGYGFFRKRREVIDGVNVFRVFQIPRGHGIMRLTINYVSYVLSACFDVLVYYIWQKKYDAIIVHEVSPIFQAYPAMLLKKITGAPIYLWILDIWPDAMMSGGGVRNVKWLSFIDKLVIGIYNNCDKLLISSKRFSENILTKGNFKDRLEYFPNWSDDLKLDQVSSAIPQLPEGFIIMLAGNLGKSQNLDAVVQAMLLLKNVRELKWVFIGDGSEKCWLEDFIKKHNLVDTAFTLGRFSSEMMPSFYKKASAMLLTLRSGFPHLGMVVPARLQSYMSAGKPVLAMIGDGGADIIKEANCGYAVPAGDYRSLAETIINKVLPNKDEFEKMGANGRLYFEREFTKSHCINRLIEVISSKK